MKINIFVVGYNEEDWKKNPRNRECLHIADAGYAQIDGFDREELWDLLNWSCWTDKKPKEVEHSPLTHCNSDVAFNIDGTDVYHCALSFGWKKINAGNLDEVLSFFKTSEDNFSFWPLYKGVRLIR